MIVSNSEINMNHFCKGTSASFRSLLILGGGLHTEELPDRSGAVWISEQQDQVRKKNATVHQSDHRVHLQFIV